jgi:arsenite methyltransferase
VGCIAGALSKSEYEAGLAATGFEQVSVTFTHQVGDGLHGAIIKATKPTTAAAAEPSTVTPAGATRGGELPLLTGSEPGCC